MTKGCQGTGAIHLKFKTKIKNKDNKGASGDRLRDLPEWLEEFTESLEDTEVPASAHISHESDSEHPYEVASRKHSIYTHSPTKTARSASEPRSQGLLAEGWEQPHAKKGPRGHTIWKDTRKSALRGVAKWQIKRQSNCTKSQHLAWMTTVSSCHKMDQK